MKPSAKARAKAIHFITDTVVGGLMVAMLTATILGLLVLYALEA